jgi:Arc/MetJ-type ribon-helix-helix transcriptional regulator
MNIELDQETERLITEEIQNGGSQNARDFIRRAIKHFVIARELGEEYTPDEIEAKIARGITSLENGEGVDGEQFLDSLEDELDVAEKAREAG